jgi:hypothetical protein
VNFVVNLFLFFLPKMFQEDGSPHCQARRLVHIRGGIMKACEDCSIAVSNGHEDLTPAQRHQVLHDIRSSSFGVRSQSFCVFSLVIL